MPLFLTVRLLVLPLSALVRVSFAARRPSSLVRVSFASCNPAALVRASFAIRRLSARLLRTSAPALFFAARATSSKLSSNRKSSKLTFPVPFLRFFILLRSPLHPFSIVEKPIRVLYFLFLTLLSTLTFLPGYCKLLRYCDSQTPTD